VAITGPAIVRKVKGAGVPASRKLELAAPPPPANDDRKPSPPGARKPAIVTSTSRKRARLLPSERAADPDRGDGPGAGLPRPHDPPKVSRPPIPKRHWRSHGNDPLPSGAEALDEPFAAFPSWFLQVTCERCGQQRLSGETHFALPDMLIRDILDRMRHDGRYAAA
jgi:hypothetical protein